MTKNNSKCISINQLLRHCGISETMPIKGDCLSIDTPCIFAFISVTPKINPTNFILLFLAKVNREIKILEIYSFKSQKISMFPLPFESWIFPIIEQDGTIFDEELWNVAKAKALVEKINSSDSK